MTKYFLPLVCLVFFTGCYKNYPHVQKYRMVMNDKVAVTYELTDPIIKDKSTLLSENKVIEFEIGPESNAIKSEKTTLFESFSFAADKGETLQVEVKSFVSAYGMKHFVAVPSITIMDEHNKAIGSKFISMKGVMEDFTPYHLLAKWDVQIPEQGQYYLVVTTDNSNLDSRVDSQSSAYYNTGAIGLMTWNFYSHYMGEMEVKLSQ